MTLSEFLEGIQDALASDTVFSNFCISRFGKNAKIWLGHDALNEPDTSEYPLVVVFFAEREQGENNRHFTYNAEIGFAVSNENIVNSGNKKTFQGVLDVEDFRDAGELALYRNFGKLETTGNTIAQSVFPVFRSNTVVSLTLHRNQRTPLGR